MSKLLVICAISMIMVCELCAQKKKSVQRHDIKAVTVLSEDYEDSKGKQVKESYTAYDEAGNVVEEIEYDNSGKEKSHFQYAYDDDGNKIRETTLNAKGVKEKIVEFKYTNGLKTERIVYYPNGKIKSKKIFKYDFN